MLWLFIGLTSGLVLGLTGAGGAIVSVPLFMHVLGKTFRESTILGLFATLFGAVFSWAIQRKETDVRKSLTFAAFALVGSKAFSLIKPHLPEGWIRGLFAYLCIHALWELWRKKRRKAKATVTDASASKMLVIYGLTGFGLGGLTVLTGLGGGVILIPALTNYFGMALTQAVPTTLLTVILSTMSSLLWQRGQWVGQVHTNELLGLAGGCILAAWGVRQILKHAPESFAQLLRRWTLSLLLVGCLISILN